MEATNCVIIGAGHAGTTLAFQLRREGWEGKIQLVSAENELPYHRPPLSKDILASKKELDDVRLRPEAGFAKNDIELLLGQSVSEIDVAGKVVHTEAGLTLGYTKLAICTGAGARNLPFAAGLSNVYSIRQAGDISGLQTQLAAGNLRSAVLIGAGYVGLEVAAVLAQQGVEVTVLETEERILSRVTGPNMSAFMQALHESRGVKIRLGVRAEEFQTEQSATASVVTAVLGSDGESYAADMVVVGIGSIPHTQLAESAGLALDNGVRVDAHCRTTVEDIYAGGDCCNFHSPLYDRRLRLESVQNANDQAKVIAANICGKPTQYTAIPWFWSDQYEVKLQMVGLSTDYDEVVCRGISSEGTAVAAAGLAKLVTNGFALFYLKQGRLLAVDAINRPKEFMVAKQLLASAKTVDTALLADDSVDPKSLLG